LHKAAKAAPRVAVYAHRDLSDLLGRLAAERIHRASELELYSIDPLLLGALAARLDRRVCFDLAISGRELYLSLGSATFSGAVSAHRIDRREG
jgi:hypothetical protein